uniref:UDP-galactose transporter n=1 Tax=Timema shepardi TaxID=629360 RepID=A0A7R9AKI5_TIMSH|nr:unnamed protein product [Timema shepardi]
MQVLKNEWAASERWVSTHVSDHSGLQYRQFLLKSLLKCLGSNSLTSAAPVQDTKQFLMQFLVSPDTNGCIVHKDEGEKSTSKLLVFLTSDLFLNTDLILRFVGHEALWYHRRFLLTTVKDLVGCGIAKRDECSSEKSILEHEIGEEDCENNGSLLHNGSNNIHLSNEGIPLEKDQKLSSIEILHDSNLDNLLRMTLLDQEQTLIAKCLPEDIHQYRLASQHSKWLSQPLALSSASLKPILWDGGREGERRGVASQPTKVSFRANKNRWITETVDGASYRTESSQEEEDFWEKSSSDDLNFDDEDMLHTIDQGDFALVKFKTKSSFCYFVSRVVKKESNDDYYVTFLRRSEPGLIVTASQGSDSLYNYNTVTVVLFTEILKLIVSTALYYKDSSMTSLVLADSSQLTSDSQHLVLLLYFVPAFLYCLYNNLAFVNLSAFDPTTYYLLLQFRVVVTGIVFQQLEYLTSTSSRLKSTSRCPNRTKLVNIVCIISVQVLFQKKLSGKQWLSLILLTVGCMVKQIDISSLYSSSSVSTTAHSNSPWEFRLSVNALLILVQTICSCCAGVFNEYLLKGEGANVNIYIQNMFMYINSIVCNAGILLIKGDLYDAFTPEALSSVFAFKVIIIMFNNAAIGIITSFFLKNLNSILKTFASALELMFTAVLCWLLFGIPIYANTVIAISIVSYAVILYSQNPVVNKIKGTTPSEMKPFLSKNGPENV